MLGVWIAERKQRDEHGSVDSPFYRAVFATRFFECEEQTVDDVDKK